MHDIASTEAASGGGPIPSGSLGVTEKTPRPRDQHGEISRPELQGGKGSGAPNLNSFMGLNTATTSVAAIAKIIQESNLQARESARLDRQQARDTDVSKQLKAADKTRDMANFNLAATAVTSAISMVGSVVSIVGAVKADAVRSPVAKQSGQLNLEADTIRNNTAKSAGGGADTQVKSAHSAAQNSAGQEVKSDLARPSVDVEIEMADMKADKSVAQAAPRPDDVDVNVPSSGGSQPNDATKLQMAEKQADLLDAKAARDLKNAEVEAANIDRNFTTAAQVTTETGKIIGAALQRVGAEKDAERMEIQAEASVARTRAEDQTDFMRAYADNVRAVLEKLSAIQQAEADTNRSIIRNLG